MLNREKFNIIKFFQLFAAGAPISYAFSVVAPTKENVSLKKIMILTIGLPSLVLCSLCFLYTNMLKG